MAEPSDPAAPPRPGTAADEIRRLREEAIAEAAGRVARMLEAGEVERAAVALRQAIDRLGAQPPFHDLSRRLDEAKADREAIRRREWAGRRHNEALGHRRDGERHLLAGRHDEAVAALESAHAIDPDDREIADLLATARTSLDRQVVSRRRESAIVDRERRVQAALEALHLEAAEALLDQATREFGDTPTFAGLRQRLQLLLETERQGPGRSARTAAAAPLSEDEALLHQRALAEAYSWRQALLYPLRGGGPLLGAGLVGLFLGLDLLHSWVPGAATHWLRDLAPLVASGVVLALLRDTVQGRNTPPLPGELLQPVARLKDGLILLVLAAMAFLPLAAFLVALSASGGPDGLGFLGWLAAAVLGWLGVAWLAVAAAAAAAFGAVRGLAWPRHLRGILAGRGDALFAVDATFVLAIAPVLLGGVTAVPWWLAAGCAAVVEAYGLLAAPHLVGVAVRRHRIELERIYRPAAPGATRG